jgi:hypothetical protein
MSGGGSYHHPRRKVKHPGQIKQARPQWVARPSRMEGIIPSKAGIQTRGDPGVLPRLTMRRVTAFREGDPLGWAVALSGKLSRANCRQSDNPVEFDSASCTISD